jgi:hypothetical protein
MQTLAKVLCGAAAAHVHILKAEVGCQEVKTNGDQQNHVRHTGGGDEHNPKIDEAHPEHLTQHGNQYVAYKICANIRDDSRTCGCRCRLSTT